MISIITPSYRQSKWLRLCLASVQDQKLECTVEHIIQDNCSGETVREVCSRFPHVKLIEEKDSGMYDAINRGLHRASGEILAYLNCDEQYLPGTLAFIYRYFKTHPEVEVLFGDVVIVDAEGSFLCCRKMVKPLASHTRFCHLGILTCATFFRRSIIERGFLFNPQWKYAGDAEWILRLLKAKIRMKVLRRYMSVFTDGSENMGMIQSSYEEGRLLSKFAPHWQSALIPLLATQHRLRKLIHSCYQQKPFDYKIYSQLNSEHRQTYHVERPRFVWEGRFTLFN